MLTSKRLPGGVAPGAGMPPVGALGQMRVGACGYSSAVAVRHMRVDLRPRPRGAAMTISAGGRAGHGRTMPASSATITDAGALRAGGASATREG